MTDQETRAPSLGRNLSGDFLKRRQRSWSGIPVFRSSSDFQSHSGTRVGPQERLRTELRTERSTWDESSLRHKLLSCALAALAVLVIAGVVLAIVGLSLDSSIVYTVWVDVGDGTLYYAQQVDTLDVLMLCIAFCGAAIIAVFSYALFSLMVGKREGRPSDGTTAGLDELKSSDLEQGDAQLKTHDSIAELMEHAEKQYVAEYKRKSAPPGIARQETGPAAKPPAEAGDSITVHRLSEPESAAIAGDAAPMVRSWSLKKMLSLRKEAPMKDMAPVQESSPTWFANSTELAAQLSSPDAFNRASTSKTGVAETAVGPEAAMRQDSGPKTPPTPTMGELMRQRRETFELADDAAALEGPRIMVTTPMEPREGSMASDSEEEMFDRGRQHSVLPHPAAEAPFCSTILTKEPQRSVNVAEPVGSIGWQDVGLDSDEEGGLFRLERGQKRPHGHMIANAPGAAGQPTTARSAELHPIDSIDKFDGYVRCFITIEFEEILPRPQAGLLNRLLRLARVESINLPERGPAFVIQPGKEYMVGLKMKQPEPESGLVLAKWIRIEPLDGQPVRFNVEEAGRTGDEWSGSAYWDTSLHSSEALACSQSANKADSIPLNLTIGLEAADEPASKLEVHCVMHVILRETLRTGREEGIAAAPQTANSVALFFLARE